MYKIQKKIKGLRSSRSEFRGVRIIKFKHKMDATPNFGVTMIPEVPSNPQLTLVESIGELLYIAIN